jgi:hypothetical protein
MPALSHHEAGLTLVRSHHSGGKSEKASDSGRNPAPSVCLCHYNISRNVRAAGHGRLQLGVSGMFPFR